MAKISIDLELGPQFKQDEDGDFYPIDGDSFEEQVLNRVADRILSNIDYSDTKVLRLIVTEKVEGIVNASVQKIIDEVASSPLQKHDYMGQPKGDPFTINELVVDAVRTFATAPDPGRDSYNRPKGAPNLTTLVQETVAAALRDELAGVVTEARKRVTEELKAKLTGAAAEAISKGR